VPNDHRSNAAIYSVLFLQLVLMPIGCHNVLDRSPAAAAAANPQPAVPATAASCDRLPIGRQPHVMDSGGGKDKMRSVINSVELAADC
jgi:hypothetical protein